VQSRREEKESDIGFLDKFEKLGSILKFMYAHRRYLSSHSYSLPLEVRVCARNSKKQIVLLSGLHARNSSIVIFFVQKKIEK